MATIISILNSKGGAGKSTIATNLARALQEGDTSVLIVDSDPQAQLATGERHKGRT